MKASPNLLTASGPVETIVLGSLMTSPDTINALTDIEPQHFTVHRPLAELIWSEISAKGAATPGMIASLAESRGIAAKADVYQIAAMAEPEQIVTHADAVVEHWRRLRQIEVTRKALADLTAGVSVDEVLNEAQGVTEMLSQKQDEKETRTGAYMAYLNEIADKMHGRVKPAPNWPWPDVTKRLGNMVPGRVLVLAARTSMGKTTTTVQIAEYASRQVPTLFISLEMPFAEILSKIVQSNTGIPREQITNGQISEGAFAEVYQSVERIFEKDLFIEYGQSNLNRIVSLIRRYARAQGVKVVVLDYLQLVSVSDRRFGSLNEQVEYISGKLKQVALSQGIFLISLSQLSRANETRGGDKRPLLSDLRNSGAIEQDADLIAFIHRPEYYKIMETSEGESTKNLTELIVAKNRHNGQGIGVSLVSIIL